MTEHKHLKRLVRQRMTRTGESYTTALRHVAGRPADATPRALPGAVVPGYRDFGGGTHRESALLSHVLEQAGITLSEAMLAGLGGGIGFMYFVFEYKGHHPTMTIVAQAHPEPVIPKALERAGIAHEVKRTGSPAVAERNLRAALDAGRPAICRIGREVAVVGIDGDTVYVDDRSAEPVEWPISEFVAEWSSVKKDRHHMITITGRLDRGSGDGAGGARDGYGAAGDDLAAGVAAAIAGTAAKMTGPVLGNAFDVNFGISGMRKFVDELGDADGKKGWARRFADPEAFFIAMTRLHDCLQTEYGAPGAMRPLYADFLDEVGGRSEAADLYRRAGAVWSEVAAAALADDAPQVTRYREIVAEREELAGTRGPRAAANRLRQLAEHVTTLTKEYGTADPLGPTGRVRHLKELAACAAPALELEEEAVALLAGAAH